MANIATRAMQWCLLSPGISLAVNQASVSLSASEKQSNLLSGKVRISPIWSLICFCHPGGPCCVPSWVCSATKLLVLKQELLPPCPGSSSVGPSGCNAGFVLLLLVHEVGLDVSPEPPKRRVGLRTAPLKAAPSSKNLSDGLERDRSYRIHVGSLHQNLVRGLLCREASL